MSALLCWASVSVVGIHLFATTLLWFHLRKAGR